MSGLRQIDLAGWRDRVPVDPEAPPSEVDLVAEAEVERRQTVIDATARRWQSICPAKLADADWDNVWYLDNDGTEIDGLRAVIQQVREWTDRALVERDPGNLLLMGELGVGKSWVALCAGKQLHFAGKTVLFAPVVELLEFLRPREHQIDISAYTSPDVLILDDLGAEKPTEWAKDRLYLLTNRRWLECRPTIVTTNLDGEGLKDQIGARIYDRLRDGATGVAIGGESRRKPRKK